MSPGSCVCRAGVCLSRWKCWYTGDLGELEEKRTQFMQVEVNNSISAGTAEEVLPGTE